MSRISQTYKNDKNIPDFISMDGDSVPGHWPESSVTAFNGGPADVNPNGCTLYVNGNAVTKSPAACHAVAAV